MTEDLSDFDYVLAAGKAVNPDDYDDFRKNMWKAAVAANEIDVPDYPDRTFEKCFECGITIQIGPRQRTQLDNLPANLKPVFLCLIDAALMQRAVQQTHGVDLTVKDLGNPHRNP